MGIPVSVTGDPNDVAVNRAEIPLLPEIAPGALVFANECVDGEEGESERVASERAVGLSTNKTKLIERNIVYVMVEDVAKILIRVVRVERKRDVGKIC